MNQDASTETRPPKTSKATTYRWIALLVLLALTVGGVLAYWRYSEIYPSTDNAYTGANIVRGAAQVAGPVVHVYVTDDDTVAVNDPLFDIDPALYEAALRNARAQFDAAANAAGTAADALKGAANTLEEKRKALGDALDKYRAAKDAQKGGEKSDQLASALQGWKDALKAFNDAQAEFDKQQDANITVTTPTVQLRAAAAQLDKATHDWVKTHVVAPVNGQISNVTVRPGSVVQAGMPAFAVVETGHWWVDANFKETDLARIKAGQPATIKLDMYPGSKLEGVVESVSAGSGAIFSVLPPENATGNWVKVTQRFPVRIRITSAPDPDRPLRAGASADVTIDTTEGKQ